MQISEIRIRNFRNFRKAKIYIKNNDTVILGENGAGKTNLFRAIRLLLDNKYNYQLKKDDYSIDLMYAQAHWIIIQVKFSDVKSEELGAFGAKLNPNDNNEAWINMFFRPTFDERTAIKKRGDAVRSGEATIEEFENYLNSMDFRTDFECVKTVGETPDYFDDAEYNLLVGDVSALKFVEAEDENAAKLGNRRGSYDAIRLINVIFVPAGRDPYEEMTGASGIIKSLISKQARKIDKTKLHQLRTDLVKVGETIESLDEFKITAKQITDKYKEALGDINAKTTNVASLISDELNDVVRYLGLNIEDGTSMLPLGYRSLGEHSIFHLVLRMVDGEVADKSKFTILMVEEPEVHLHTHLQRTLFIRLQNKKDMQLIFSTHSNNISYATRISKMVILEQKTENIEIYYPSNGIDINEVNKTERYLDANRTPLLFAKRVLLVEGDAEAIVLPWLFEKHSNHTLDEYCISLVKVDSAFFDRIATLFHKERINRSCFILTDKDTDFTKLKSNARAEQIGLTRFESLNKLHKENSLITPFFAENTFEIQLLEKNLDILVKIIEAKLIYSQDSKIKEIIKNLILADIETQYSTILKCVEYIGKGWFALLLVDFCRDYNLTLELPDYIAQAFKEIVSNI